MRSGPDSVNPSGRKPDRKASTATVTGPEIERAREEGLTAPPRTEANPSRWRPGAEIVQARKAEYERLKASGDGRTIRKIHLADDKPYAMFFLGDPHLDNPGTDLALWERWIAPLNYRKHVHGFGLGDWLDNWLRVLGHL